MNGERKTGVTTFLLSKRVDSGDIIKMEETIIGKNETYGELRNRLSRIGGRLLVESIKLVGDGFKGRAQKGNATYAPKIKKEERRINWDKTAEEIKNLICALSPAPGAYTTFRGKRLIILTARVSPSKNGKPGEIIYKEELFVSAKKGLLELLELKPEGKGAMSAYAFGLGYRPTLGEVMG